MKTLRAKLFLSIGSIFFVVALLNILFSEKWIHRALAKTGHEINSQVALMEDKIHQFTSFLLTFQIVKEAAELDRIAQPLLSFSKDSLWENAKTILSINPRLSFVQIRSNSGEVAVITPQENPPLSFSWSLANEGRLWIKVEGDSSLYIGVPKKVGEKTVYLLFDTNSLPDQAALFQKVEPSIFSYYWEDSPEDIYQTLLAYQNESIEKLALVQALLPSKESKEELNVKGALFLASDPKRGWCVLTEDLFSSKPFFQDSDISEAPHIPTLVLRQTRYGKTLDMVRVFAEKQEQIALGFSLSSSLKHLAVLSGKSVVATGKNFAIGYTDKGTLFDPVLEKFPLNEAEEGKNLITWQNSSYATSFIDLDILKLYVLTPEAEALSMEEFLNQVSEKITWQVSISLFAASFFSFIIALILLTNISKKITEPIAILSKASEELSQGNYEHITLPKIAHRKDEVATLAHSFESMVAALQDRDKIRGVLNKVVSKEISEQILKTNIELGGEEKILTLLFCDIRSFTKLAEGLPPYLLIEILNRYMTRMCRIIDKTHGVVDKFIGDEIMTLYGAPLALDFHATKAIEAALLMKEDLLAWNRERSEKKEPVFEAGIGIHTGLVYTGNMGAENRLNYTAIGANVNQASRICSVAKPMQILISEDTWKQPRVAELFLVEKLEPVLLKGIDHPVQIYEVTGFRSTKLQGSTIGS